MPLIKSFLKEYTLKNLKKLIPARIYVLYSKDSQSAVILRRGPSRWVLSLGWDLKTDHFQKGQWLFGKIENERCAISEDGQYWFYRAYKKEEYLVVAKCPYFKSIYLSIRSGCFRYQKGSYFNFHKLKQEHNGFYFDPEYLKILTHVESFFEKDKYVFESHMIRKKWESFDQYPYGHLDKTRFSLNIENEWQLSLCTVELGNRREDGGDMPHVYTLKHLSSNTDVDTKHWEWADYDAFNQRMIWAEMGKIMTANLTHEDNQAILENKKCLLDMNDMVFEELIAPY